jgi:hypothetical protein
VNAEHAPKSPADKTGLFATLSNLLRAKGSGAPAALCATLALLAFATVVPSAASAKQARLFTGTFGAASNPYPLLTAESGIAVDRSSGDVYVSDRLGARVEKFDSAGHFILMFGNKVNKTKVEEFAEPGNPHGITEAEQDLCTLASGDECQVGDRNTLTTPLEESGYLAVDNSPGPSQGDVYVSSGQNAAVGLVDKFDSSGQLVESWASGGRLDGSTVISPPAPIAGPFGRIGGIDVDLSGNLWVSAASTTVGGSGNVFQFHQDASFAAGWSTGSGVTTAGIAVDAEDHLYVNNQSQVTKYDSIGKDLGVVAPSKAEVVAHGNNQNGGTFQIRSLAFDPSTADLYLAGYEVTNGSEVGVIKRYDSSCHPLLTNEPPGPGCDPAEAFAQGLISTFPYGLAVDPATHDLYVAEDQGTAHVAAFQIKTVPGVLTTKPTSPTHTSATLTGTINPSGIELNEVLKGCRFEWGLTTAPYEHIVPCDKSAAQIGAGNSPVEVQADITGLEAGNTYHYRLVASNHNDVNELLTEPSLGADLAFGPPLIESASAIAVAAASATLQAQANPNDLDTHLRIEYGTEAGVYGHSTEELDIGSAATVQSASLHLQGLSPATTYHYRLVAENVLAEGADATLGADLTFTTQGTGAPALPDSRRWELISPPNKLGANIYPLGLGGGVVEASPTGNAITYLANAPTESGPSGNIGSEVQVLSARGPAAWATRDITLPHATATGTGRGEVTFFSPDLSRVVVQPLGSFDPSLSPEASEQTAYLHTNYPGADSTTFCATSCYHPLVTGAEGFANVPPFTEFGEGACPAQLPCGPTVFGVSPDGSHFILISKAPLTESAPAGSLYEWSDGQLQLVSILPGAAGPASAASGPLLGDLGNSRNAISTDGSRVVWYENQGPSSKHHLYLRDTAREETLQLDTVRGGTGKGTAEPHFQTASADDSRIFFTDEQQLTPGSGAAKGKSDLYECEVIEGKGGELECNLTDLSPESSGESSGIQGVPGASDDGSYAYFIANGVLTGAEENEHHEKAQPGACAGAARPGATCNLYLRHGGTTRFIAVLSGEDTHDWATGGGTETQLQRLTAGVSPGGRWLAFMSQRSLTGYDNRDVVSNQPDEEVYLYHASAQNEEGTLLCSSCDPTGARPDGVKVSEEALSLHSGGWPATQWIAANIPSWTGRSDLGGGFDGKHQPRYLSDSGRLFFNSSDALVPRDSNGTGDVYQYEPPGVGDCSEESPSFAKSNGGCISLITSGTSKDESAFLDASESGNDVFFLTKSQLTHRDIDTSFDVYDASVGGGEEEPIPPPLCEGDGCQQPAVPPNDPTPGSLTFHGAGNVNEAKAKKKHSKKHKKKAHKKQKLATTHKHGGAK